MVCLTRRAEESRNEGDRSDFQKLQAAVPRVFVHSGCADNKDFPVSDLRPINVWLAKLISTGNGSINSNRANCHHTITMEV